MTRPEKAAVAERFRQDYAAAKGVALLDFRGLSVAEMTRLRKKLSRAGVSLRVIKNTLACRALPEGPLRASLTRYFDGPTAVALSATDSAAPVKLLFESKKELEKLTLKAAVVEGQFYDGGEIEALATLPAREVLLARLAGALGAPIAGLGATLHAVLAQFPRTLEALRARRETETGDS